MHSVPGIPSAQHAAIQRLTPSVPAPDVRIERGKTVQMALKRAIDVVLSALGLLLLSPLLLLVAVAIKLDSPGPVLFKQTRVGLATRTFQILKFRTMTAGADRAKKELARLNHTGDRRLFKIVRDPRVTRVGRVFRKYSIDELPQLWNVLRGEMSLVGPRPFFPEDLRDYEPHHLRRYSVIPGITGAWQTNGRSELEDFESVIRHDLEYIDNWSIARDLAILAKTIPVVLSGRGAM